MLEFADYFDVLKKRKWVLLVWIVVGLVGAGVAFLLLPKVYRSSTLILVESQKVPTDYIKPMAVDTIEERLIAIQQQILSRTLLQKIIEEFHVYDDELKRQPLEDVIDLMRRDIKITMVDDRFHRNIQAFTISYDSDVPALAMQVTNKLAALFIGENLKVREQLVEGTSEFLEQELFRVKEKLDRQEAEISQYKQKHIGQLPQQEEAMFRTLDRLTMELQTQNDMLRMLVERKEIMHDAIETSAGTPGGVVHLSPKG
ncbi:MAG TPA: Wzz/FepE/Etk N-terminal domain-containing protein, partial [Terriglobia bacterium]|nr:Wzz/FepE/Etk N-terminal domain-containing protein [Terriglobia bacterium]